MTSKEGSETYRFLTTARDPGGRPTIFDALPPGLPRLVPVGVGGRVAGHHDDREVAPTRVAAAVCLFALMLVMFPANLYASRMPNPPKSMTIRLPIPEASNSLDTAA